MACKVSKPMSNNKGKLGKIGHPERKKSFTKMMRKMTNSRFCRTKLMAKKRRTPRSTRSPERNTSMHSHERVPELVRYERRRRKTPVNFINTIRENPIQAAASQKIHKGKRVTWGETSQISDPHRNYLSSQSNSSPTGVPIMEER